MDGKNDSEHSMEEDKRNILLEKLTARPTIILKSSSSSEENIKISNNTFNFLKNKPNFQKGKFLLNNENKEKPKSNLKSKIKYNKSLLSKTNNNDELMENMILIDKISDLNRKRKISKKLTFQALTQNSLQNNTNYDNSYVNASNCENYIQNSSFLSQNIYFEDKENHEEDLNEEGNDLFMTEKNNNQISKKSLNQQEEAVLQDFLKFKKKRKSESKMKFMEKIDVDNIEFLNPVKNQKNFEINYNHLEGEFLAYSVYDRLFKNNYVYFPENNEYFHTGQEENLKTLHILLEENLKQTMKNYIICLIPFDKISCINLEYFYNLTSVELKNKIKEEILNKIQNIDITYNLNLNQLMENLTNFINNIKNKYYKKNLHINLDQNDIYNTFQSEKYKSEFHWEDLKIENNITNFSIFPKELKKFEPIVKNIPPAPKLKINNSYFLPDLENKDGSFTIPTIPNIRNSYCVGQNFNKNINDDYYKFEDINNFFRDYFHPKLLNPNNFFKKNHGQETKVDKYNPDIKTKNISNTYLLYSNVSKEFPFEFVLNKKYKTNKKKSEIRIIERENFIIEHFEKFSLDRTLPRKLKIKNFGDKLFNFDFVDKKNQFSGFKLLEGVVTSKRFIFNYINYQLKNEYIENFSVSDFIFEVEEEIRNETIQKMLEETFEKNKRKVESIKKTNKKISDALNLPNIKIPRLLLKKEIINEK